MKPRILLVDDEENILKQLRWALEPDYEVLITTDEYEAKKIFEAMGPAVVTIDLSLSPANPQDLAGLRLLEHFLTRAPSTRIIVVTGSSDEASALQAVRLGAFDYYSKPIRLNELKVMIQRAFHIHHLHQRAQQNFSGPAEGFHGIIGKSKNMQEIFRFIERLDASDVSVLISGEDGTGKKLLAHTIHNLSQRKSNPFVVVNCAAIPQNSLESELFGHETGAFVGAYAQKCGKLESAHTGTLFLDQISELAPALQVKLLRFLQTRKIERVRGTQTIDLDIRIIAATNRDLQKDIENHVFHKERLCRGLRKPPVMLSPEAEGALLMHSWPGNIRELKNIISRAVVLNSHSFLKPSDLGFALNSIPTDVNLKFAKKAIEADFIKKALSKNNGIVSRAAKDLGISRINLYEPMDR